MRRISSGSAFEEAIGYVRTVNDGQYVFISGTTGYDYTNHLISDNVIDQAEQCFHNLGVALRESGCDFCDVVRVRYILPQRADFEPCWPVFKKYFGATRPAATMIVAGLFDPAMKLEVELTARLPDLDGKLR